MGKHFFGHNNKHFFSFFLFFFFSFFLFPFSLWFRALRCTHILDSTVPRTATFCRYPSYYSTLPTVLFDSWDPRLSPTLCYSVVLPYTYYADSTNRLCDFRILEFISFLGFCFLPTHGCSAVATGKYPPNTIPNKYFCIKMSHFDYDKHYID